MSDFKVIKCKKCSAPLVEMAGEKLDRCVQCGYKFSINTKPAKRIDNSSQSKIATPEVSSMVRKLRQLKTTKVTDGTKATEIFIPKKKSNPIVTIIVWIIVLNIARKLFFN